MKRISYVLMCLAMLTLGTSASAASKKVASVKDSLYVLTSGNVVMSIDATGGAKVTSMKLDGKELIAQHVPGVGFRNNVNDYGATFWPSPQAEWNWPPIKTYDAAPYTVEVGKKSVKMTSGKDEKYPYVFVKEYKVCGKGAYEIVYTIKNVSDKEVSVAPWEITRVPGAGKIFFDAPSVRPAEMLPSESKEGLTWLPFVADDRQNRKIFADGKGWLAFANDGMLYVKQFDDIKTSDAAPEEDEIEIYVNRGTTYIEIENQGAYKKIAPGASLTWVVRWTLLPAADNLDAAALKALAKKALK